MKESQKFILSNNGQQPVIDDNQEVVGSFHTLLKEETLGKTRDKFNAMQVNLKKHEVTNQQIADGRTAQKVQPVYQGNIG